ncbi:hypothetical protein HANVADRAFT_51649 [Hanseniaspora valbyensis NRRL Y-1626]|uniref:Uncharacterized protein n=1 Tax=Hanseniaspora valbyensis NRRL Y-1626 TaxID=766949 RepID=A0A1B7THW7_9ASCO|nr:hypothetical protein HANVADRAFT_51649 [Hanseniaspora valbyensis NRRL Y-1626]
MSTNASSQQKTLKKLNKMLDIADKTGSTSELANINNTSNLTTFDNNINNTDASIVYTPFKDSEKENVIPASVSNTSSEKKDDSIFSASLGKKMINVTKELPDIPSSAFSNTSSQGMKPPVRNRNRPQSLDASPLTAELNKSLNNISPPSSFSKNTRLPLSPRKYDLQKEKNKRQSLDDVQVMLTEQIEELKSIASGNKEEETNNNNNNNSNKLNFFPQPPNSNGKNESPTGTYSTDQFYSAANTLNESQEDESVKSQEEENAENIGFIRSSDLSIKKVDGSIFVESQRSPNKHLKQKEQEKYNGGENNNEDEDYEEYEDLVEEEEEMNQTTNKKKKNHTKRNLKSKTNKFDVNTMEMLLSNLDQVNDFDNLAMRDEEKKYLQLLVGNLSKLTADMILDPSKYDEGLRRLKKAALALEGF